MNKFSDPRNRGLPREEQFCPGCGKLYVNIMSLIHHVIFCDGYLQKQMEKLCDVTELIVAGEKKNANL